MTIFKKRENLEEEKIQDVYTKQPDFLQCSRPARGFIFNNREWRKENN